MTVVASPLQAYSRLSSNDVDYVRDSVAKVFCSHRLEPHNGVTELKAWQNSASLTKSSLSVMSYGAPVTIDPGYLETFYLMMLPFEGRAAIEAGDRSFISDANTASLLNPDESVRMNWDGNCAKRMVRIERAAMEQQLARLLDRPLRQPLRFDPVMRMDSRAMVWWRYVGLLIDELDALGPAASKTASVEQLESLLMTSVLEVQPHNYSEAMSQPRGAIAPRHVRQVERYIEAHAREPIDIVRLIEVSGVSARTLFEGFQRFRGTSPMAYLRGVRLKGVRDTLLRGPAGRTVSEIATEWQFFELGRFAGLYRQCYGETPSQTLRRSLR
ncbi:AraC family transcriptional regulator [Novosphingobium taihuense]|uniref:AraC-like DNA-binding protein n=1 Tax=Novosphingobium taihuense TaxID=260085 RepID=A0A7W7AAN2_9SPHN|nr:AraC family transcriptional regulator [Novosphingobium taihuense]MBB4613372.1 AraC-like DNA-binding protein [Novosphingobium taihuense]TWH85512.1 AraC-like DNA-binding protein [Novosphingobium taihuense]